MPPQIRPFPSFSAALIALTALSSPAVVAAPIGSCEAADNSVYDHYDFNLEGTGAEQSLHIRGRIGNASPSTIHMLNLSRKSVVENTAHRLKIEDGNKKLNIDTQTGAGNYSESGWTWVCAPGNSEWCAIKVPRKVNIKRAYSNCRFKLPL